MRSNAPGLAFPPLQRWRRWPPRHPLLAGKSPHPLCVPVGFEVDWAYPPPTALGPTNYPTRETSLAELWKRDGYTTACSARNHSSFRHLSSSTSLRVGPRRPRQRQRAPGRPGRARFVRQTRRLRGRPPRVSTPSPAAYRHLPGGGADDWFMEKHRYDQFAAWVSFPDPHTPFQVCIPSIHVSADRSRSASARRELEIKPERHRAFHRLVRMDEQTETDIER